MGMCLNIDGFGVKIKNGDVVTKDDVESVLKKYGCYGTEVSYNNKCNFFDISYEGSYSGGVLLQEVMRDWSEDDNLLLNICVGDFESPATHITFYKGNAIIVWDEDDKECD